MTDQEILAKFTRILRDLLLDDSIELTMETRREDVPNWDSFNYINFIVAVEMEFGVKFKVADIESFPNVGAIVKKRRRCRLSLVEREACAAPLPKSANTCEAARFPRSPENRQQD